VRCTLAASRLRIAASCSQTRLQAIKVRPPVRPLFAARRKPPPALGSSAAPAQLPMAAPRSAPKALQPHLPRARMSSSAAADALLGAVLAAACAWLLHVRARVWKTFVCMSEPACSCLSLRASALPRPLRERCHGHENRWACQSHFWPCAYQGMAQGQPLQCIVPVASSPGSPQAPFVFWSW
jgi:hypothetical protein